MAGHENIQNKKDRYKKMQSVSDRGIYNSAAANAADRPVCFPFSG